jgi:hypothetical protein
MKSEIFYISSQNFKKNGDPDDVILEAIKHPYKNEKLSLIQRATLQDLYKFTRPEIGIKYVLDNDIYIPKKIIKHISIADVIIPTTLKSKSRLGSNILRILKKNNRCFVVFYREWEKKNKLYFGFILEHIDSQSTTVNSVLKGEIN